MRFYDALVKYTHPLPTLIAVESSGNEFNFSKSMNIGINEALKLNSEYIILTNDDIVVTENWLEPLLESFSTTKEIGFCVPKIAKITQNGFSKPTFPIIKMPSRASILFAATLGKVLPDALWSVTKELLRYAQATVDTISNNVADTSAPAWGFMINVQPISLTKTHVIADLGGFDERFKNGCEDFDLSIRACPKNYKMCANARSLVYDIGGASSGGFALLRGKHTRQKRVQIANNWLQLARKYEPNIYKNFLLRCATQTYVVNF